jgi:hypothetical protein
LGSPVVILVAVTAGGLPPAGVGAVPTPAQKKAAALNSLQAQLKAQVAAFMAKRTSFFAAERKYLPAMKDARASIAKFDKKTKAVDQETEQTQAACLPVFTCL